MAVLLILIIAALAAWGWYVLCMRGATGESTMGAGFAVMAGWLVIAIVAVASLIIVVWREIAAWLAALGAG